MQRIHEFKPVGHQVIRMSMQSIEEIIDQVKVFRSLTITQKKIITDCLLKIFFSFNEQQALPLSNEPDNPRLQDYRRFKDLCTAYETCLHKPIPNHWSLDNNDAPKWHMSFQLLEDNLSNLREVIPNKTQFINETSDIILYKIIFLMKQLTSNSRLIDFGPWRGVNYRQDGFEMMCLTELAYWAFVELLNAVPNNKKTLIMLSQRIKYLERLNQIFIDRAQSEENKEYYPNQFFIEVMEDLKALRERLEVTHYLDIYYGEIDDLLRRGLISNTFKWLYNLMADTPDELFFPENTIEHFKRGKQMTPFFEKSVIGQWIFKTLDQLGVQDDFYDLGPKLSISCKDIECFVMGQLNLLSGDSQLDYGFHPFIKSGSELEMWLMTKLRDIFICILKLAYLQQQLSKMRDVSPSILDLIKQVVDQLVSKLIQKMSMFWQEFYLHEFLGEKLSASPEYSHCAEPLRRAERLLDQNKAIYERIKVCLDEIKLLPNRYASTVTDVAALSDKIILSNLHDYIELAKKLTDFCKGKKAVAKLVDDGDEKSQEHLQHAAVASASFFSAPVTAKDVTTPMNHGL